MATAIIEAKEGKIYDCLREKEFNQHKEIEVSGEKQSTEEIFESIKMEQIIWKSIENGTNCKIASIIEIYSKHINIWTYWCWEKSHNFRKQR
jgi:hypothetical protein